MKIEKYSIGIGDRFAKEGVAQLDAIRKMDSHGIEIVPVWNKSFREHSIIKTTQESVLQEASNAVRATNWNKNFYIDADHIGLETVDAFLPFSNFFTIDVAHFISKHVDEQGKMDFTERYSHFIGKLQIPGIEKVFDITEKYLGDTADKYLLALREVSRIYKYIEDRKGAGNFIAEVSMDETGSAQSPLDLYFILSELKYYGVELQTIAPRFSGLFAKGIDYIGNIIYFSNEFEQDLAVLKYASDTLGLPDNLKLSVHSGSDKFSLYPRINASLKKYNAGIHVKTAGTTWLEEVAGLAESGGEALMIAKDIYIKSLERYDELTAPYESVLSIHRGHLPRQDEVFSWNSSRFVNALTHDKSCKEFNPDLRQLIHVGYKIAVEMGERFTQALDVNRAIIEERVTYNLLEKHLKPLFL